MTIIIMEKGNIYYGRGGWDCASSGVITTKACTFLQAPTIVEWNGYC